MVDVNMLNDFNALILKLNEFVNKDLAGLDSKGKTEHAVRLKNLVTMYNKNSELLNINNLKNALSLIHSLIISSVGSLLADYYPKRCEDKYSEILGLYANFISKYKLN